MWMSQIDGAYPYHLFTSYSIGANAIILNDTDYDKVLESVYTEESSFLYVLCIQCPRMAEDKEPSGYPLMRP